MSKINAMAVIGLATLALFFSGCGTKNLEASLQKEAPADVRTVSLSYMDSVSVNGMGSGVRIRADYPTYGSPLVVNSIREWISESMGGTYAGSLADGKDMLQYYVKSINKDFQKELAEYEAPEEDMSWYSFNEFTKTYETDLLVTYNHVFETYTGGAHGSHGATGQTFRKIDGRRMDWSVFQSNRLEDLRHVVKKAIQEQYFEMDEDEFKNLILEEQQLYFPLPETPPCFLEDGVEFTYQVYEIAPYAAGQPSCVIPYEILSPYFSTTGKSLISNTTIANN